MDKRYKTGQFAEMLGVTVKTLQNWDRAGKLKANRTITGKRYYTDEHLEQVKKMEQEKSTQIEKNRQMHMLHGIHMLNGTDVVENE